jgi:glycosyltransferase involved in cell wall biosynthesis
MSARGDSGWRRRVALVLDVEYWAFSNIARQIERYLSDRFDFVLVPVNLFGSLHRALLAAAKCDLIHFFWRQHLSMLKWPESVREATVLCGGPAAFEQLTLVGRRLTTSIYDHLFLSPEERLHHEALFRRLLTGYTVCSRRLEALYSSFPEFPPPDAVVQDGVDLTLFLPENLGRFERTEGRELVVGWVGNSAWSAEIEDFKGVQTILKPAIERLRAEGLPICLELVDAKDRAIPHSEMPAFYSRVDLYVCVSKIEGTPNPVLEAMACGVPVISTDVGVVMEAFGPQQTRFILSERSIDGLAAALRTLIEEPALLVELSRENLRMIPAWDWRERVQGFGEFFDMMFWRPAYGGV